MARYDFEVRKTVNGEITIMQTEHLKDVPNPTHAAQLATKAANDFMAATGETDCTGAAVPQE